MKNEPCKQTLVALVLLVGASAGLAVDRYWVGTNSTNWSSDASWSATSGGAGGAGVPGSGDTAIFDAGSSNNCLVDAGITVSNLTLNAGFAYALQQGAGRAITVNSGFTQNGGVFVGGADNITFKGTASFSGGTFTNTSATLESQGTWTNVTGTAAFFHNNGKVKFSYPSGYPHTRALTPGSFAFYDVELVGTYDCTRNLNGTLYVAHGLTFSGDATWPYGSLLGGAISLQGDARMASNYGNMSTALRLVGTGDQSLVADGIGVFPPTTIDKPSGNVIFAGSQSTIKVLNAWTWIAGDGLTHSNKTLRHSGPYASSATITPGTNTYGGVYFEMGYTATFVISGVYRVGGDLTVSYSTSGGADYLNGGTNEVAGNLTIACLDSRGGFGGTATLILNGSSNQVVSVDPVTAPPGSAFRIEKPNGTAILSTNLNVTRSGQQLVLGNTSAFDLGGWNLAVNGLADLDGTLRLKGSEIVTAGTLALDTNLSTVVYYDHSVAAHVTNLATKMFGNLTFGAGKTHYFGSEVPNQITVFGKLDSDGSGASRSILRSEVDGQFWYLKLAGSSILGNKVDVKDSDARPGLKVQAVGSKASGNCHNWGFGAGTVVWFK